MNIYHNWGSSNRKWFLSLAKLHILDFESVVLVDDKNYVLPIQDWRIKVEYDIDT